MFCRFEDRLAGRALQLDGARARIEARAPDELQPALDAIEDARRQGKWVALLLDFELGEWLLPLRGRAPGRPPALARPGVDTARREAPWPADHDAVGGIDGIAPRLDRARYLARIDAIRCGISQGAYYQVNYTMPLDMRVRGDRRALYTRIAQRNPVAHAAYIEDADQAILSFSPELFVARQGERLTTRPMKGTAPRHADPARDQALGQALLASEKNRAENLMIVDLLRNDLGRLARPGSVHVDALFTLERYPTVWTLTSTVTARAPVPGWATSCARCSPAGR